MLRSSKIISLVSVIAAGIGLTSAQGYNAYALKDSWQEDYLDVIAITLQNHTRTQHLNCFI